MQWGSVGLDIKRKGRLDVIRWVNSKITMPFLGAWWEGSYLISKFHFLLPPLPILFLVYFFLFESLLFECGGVDYPQCPLLLQYRVCGFSPEHEFRYSHGRIFLMK